jgi:hypothetical protein
MQMDRQTATVNPAGSPKIIDTTPREDYKKKPAQRFETLAARLVRVPKAEVDEQARKRKRD